MNYKTATIFGFGFTCVRIMKDQLCIQIKDKEISNDESRGKNNNVLIRRLKLKAAYVLINHRQVHVPYPYPQ